MAEGKKILWKKIGKGSHRIGNKIIKPGQTFYAYPDQISETMRTFIVPLDELPAEEIVVPIESFYKLQERGKGWFDIVDSKGKVINENALRREAALKFIQSLS